VGNWRKDSVGSSEALLVRSELLRMGGGLAASRRLASSGSKGNGTGCIELTALITVGEKVPFMLIKVKCEVNPDQCSLEFEGTTLRKLLGYG
jgi:hypothetical protein